jgi:predicted small lipoprotein YifL
MAAFRKSFQMLVVLLGLLITGCGDKQSLGLEPHSKVLEASAQLSCSFGSTYNRETKKCEPLEFFENKNAVTPKEVSAQFVSIPQIVRDSGVIDRVVARPGDGCMSLTAKTELALDKEACEKLAKLYDRKVAVLVRLGKVVHIEAPIVKVGEEWFLYQNTQGEIEWKIPND